MGSWVLVLWDPEEGPQTTTLLEQDLKQTTRHAMRTPGQLRTRSKLPVSGRDTQVREKRSRERTGYPQHQVSSHCRPERDKMSWLKGTEL